MTHLSKIKLATLDVDVSQKQPSPLILICLFRHVRDLLYSLELIPA